MPLNQVSFVPMALKPAKEERLDAAGSPLRPALADARGDDGPISEDAGREPSPGERLYAIGDVHGRVDLFEQLVGLIREDCASRPAAVTKIVVLGDFIDRGPQSAQLLQRLMKYSQASDRFIVLMGNHEQMLLSSLEGDFKSFKTWLKLGGEASLLSWGVPAEVIDQGPISATLKVIKKAIPEQVVLWIRQLPLWYASGDVLFVHAGYRPGAELSLQEPDDLLWGCREFLRSPQQHPFLVVHGDNFQDEVPELLPYRIGVDTGAYQTNHLTAVGLEGGERWVVAT